VPIILAMNVLWQTTSRDLLADVMTLGKFGPFTGIFKFRSQFGNVTSHLHTHNDMQMNILPRSSCPLKEMSWMMNGINAGHSQPRSPQLTCSGFKARVIRYGLLSFEDTITLLNTLPQFPKGVLSSRTSQPIIRVAMDLPYSPAGTGWAIWSDGASSATSSEQEKGPPSSQNERKVTPRLKFGLRPGRYLGRSLYGILMLICQIRKPDGPISSLSGPINKHNYSLPNFESYEYSSR
jgi:hypothetical protein